MDAHRSSTTFNDCVGAVEVLGRIEYGGGGFSPKLTVFVILDSG
jgi:hypothetical protein